VWRGGVARSHKVALSDDPPFPFSLKDNNDQGIDHLASQQLRGLRRLKEKSNSLFARCILCLLDDPLEVFYVNVSVDLGCLEASVA
jgi:hypothetical protein